MLDLGIPKADFLGHKESVNSIALSKDGKYLISGSSDNPIKIWDYKNGREIKTLGGDSGYKESVAISRYGKYTVCGCENGSIKIMSFGIKRYVKTLIGHSKSVNSVAIS